SALSSVAYYNRYPGRLYASVCIRLNLLRNDPDFFQKICQVVCAALLIKMTHDPQPSPLSSFAHVFSTVNMQDIYRLFKLPQTFLFPISINRIDAKALL